MNTKSITQQQVLTDALFPLKFAHSSALVRDLLLIFSFSLFIVLCAQIAIPLPFTVIPLTLQTLGVLLTGAALGSRRGAIVLLLYLSYGALGAPVFAGGTGGIIKFTGFTAGYLLAFPLAAFITGWLCEKGLDRNLKTSFLAMIPGSLLIYVFGVLWLAYLSHQSLPAAINQGMIPFIPGDIIKILSAGLLLPLAWKYTGKN